MTRPRNLRVDPIACHAHGLCADLLPELVDLDEWGYPVLTDGTAPPSAPASDPSSDAAGSARTSVPGRRRTAVAVPDGLLDAARTAVAACPTLALRLTRDSYPPGV
jgi:ferredoxin